MNSYLSTSRREIDLKLSELDKWMSTAKIEKKHLEEAALDVADHYRAQEALQQVAEEVQKEAHKRISSVVTKCLKIVFGEDAYSFRIKFEQKRGKTDAVLQFKRGKHTIDPITGAGGGPVDIASFALRLAVLSLQLPAKRRLILMDEPFNTLHKSLQIRVRQMLEMLAEELNFQFVLITHDSELATGKVITLE